MMYSASTPQRAFSLKGMRNSWPPPTSVFVTAGQSQHNLPMPKGRQGKGGKEPGKFSISKSHMPERGGGSVSLSWIRMPPASHSTRLTGRGHRFLLHDQFVSRRTKVGVAESGGEERRQQEHTHVLPDNDNEVSSKGMATGAWGLGSHECVQDEWGAPIVGAPGVPDPWA